MSTGYLELFIEQGETFSADIKLETNSKGSFELDRYFAKSEIRKSYWSANTTAVFDTVVYNNGINDMITISLDSGITQNIASGRYVYDVFITCITNNVRTKVMGGILTVNPSSTKI